MLVTRASLLLLLSFLTILSEKVYGFKSNSYSQSDKTSNKRTGPTKTVVDPLVKSVKSNQIYRVSYLLQHGSNPNVKDETGNFIIFYALEHKRHEMLKLLLKFKANPNVTSDFNFTPLISASHLKDNLAINWLLNQMANPNVVEDVSGNSPLFTSISTNNFRGAKLLLEHGADPNIHCFSGATSLHIASTKNLNLVKLLLNHKADVNSKTELNDTPLIYASGLAESKVLQTSTEIAQLLIEHGADVNAKNATGETSLHIAVSGNIEFVKVLLNHGADINAKSNQGLTPLMFAVLSHKIEIVRYLVLKGSDKSLSDKAGKTAHDYAVEQKLIDVLADLP